MRRRPIAARLGFGVTVLLVLASPPARAQRRAASLPARGPAGVEAGRASEIVRIRALQGVGKQCLIKTPEFRTSLPSAAARPQDWAEIRVVFDTAPEWVDELVVQYYVLTVTVNKDKGGKLYSFYKTTGRYLDVAEGNGHMVAVYLPPQALKRHGLPVAVAVEMSVGEQMVAEQSESDRSVPLPENWWRDQTVLGNQKLTSRSEYLLTRKQSPFALVNIDDYEAER